MTPVPLTGQANKQANAGRFAQATNTPKFDTVRDMRGFVPPDPETQVSAERYAVVYVPKRSRKRFPSACVDIVESEQAAIDQSDEANKRFAAKVLGPSKSSEGQFIFYLVKWL